MQKPILILTTLFLLLVASAQASTKKINEVILPNGLKLTEYKLDNGMQLLFLPDHSAPVFTYQVWFKVGSLHEKLDPQLQRTGLAHLFEHMMFRGTKKHGDQVFTQKISEAGAVGNNATTYYDRTNYFEQLPKERLELIFDLESDRMVNLALDDKLFHTELGAVLGEYKMNRDKPQRVAYESLWDLAYDSQPYKYTVIGTEAELRGFKVEEAQYFYKTYYAPNNAALILIGDFSIPQALKLAEKYYGKIPRQEIPRRDATEETPQKKARRREETHPMASSVQLLLGFRVPGVNHADTATLEALAAVLAYGESSLLEQGLVGKNLASSMFASANKLHNQGLFIIGAQIAPGKTESDVMAVMDKNIQKIQNNELSEEEVQRAKNQFLLGTYNELNEQTAIGMLLGESLVSAGNYLRGFELLNAIKKVSGKDIARVAKIYLTKENSSTLIMSPVKK